LEEQFHQACGLAVLLAYMCSSPALNIADVLRFDTQQLSASGLPVAQGFLNSLSSHGRVAKLPHQGYIPGTY
jgi:hypothetical protein